MGTSCAGPARLFNVVCSELCNQCPPSQANLHLWGKKPSPTCQLCPERQTLQHVLNHCSTAVEMRRYNERHDDILASYYSFASTHLQPGHRITVDLPGKDYVLPQDVTTTDSRANLVIWSQESIALIELTVPFEEGMEAVAERKRAKYGTCWPDVPPPDVLPTSSQSRWDQGGL